MSVISKSNEKVAEVLALMPSGFSDDQFIEKFQEVHGKDWGKIEAAWYKHESGANRRDKKPGKAHPMPNPRQYVLNISHKARTAKRTEQQQQGQF